MIGEENMPKTVEKFQEIKYNESRRFDLLRQYKETVENKEVTNIGFEKYEIVMKEAKNKIVGVKTSNGFVIKSISKHLVDRIIGSEQQKRLGVNINEVVETLKNGEIVKKTSKSVKYRYKTSEVSINPLTGNVIQCNPYFRGEK